MPMKAAAQSEICAEKYENHSTVGRTCRRRCLSFEQVILLWADKKKVPARRPGGHQRCRSFFAGAAGYVSRSEVGPTSPVHHGTKAFIRQVAPFCFSSFSKISWISRSS